MSTKSKLKKKIKKASAATDYSVMSEISSWGIKSNHAYSAGMITGALSGLTWCLSRRKKQENSRTGMWSLYFGTCAATMFGIGAALKEEEKFF